MEEAPRVLMLNADWQPLRILTWERAMMLWFEEKIEILEEYDDFDIKTVSFTIKCPAVIRLLQFVNGRKHRVKFSRVNVFHRDNYTCSYCGDKPGTSELTYDHIVPRAQGGKTTWENIATSCVPCNFRKADRTPEQAKMKLRINPVKPSWTPTTKIIALPKTPDKWRSYLYWNAELENENS